MKKIRILIADDHDVVRSGLRMLLRSRQDIAIVGEAADGEEAVQLADKLTPDLAILDISMPKLDGIAATKIIKQNHPDIKIVVLTVHEEEEYAYQILQAGANGYLLKNAGKKDIFQAIQSAISGERFFSPGISRVIVEGFIKRAGEQAPKADKPVVATKNELTEREMEILRYIAEGQTSKQIADQLFLSFRTVNTHRANLMQKLNIHDTAGLVRYAINQGIVKPG
ncbi:MAG TPA: response regulator transcription factor [Bacteroidota bacterium]|nr:response regulator transcription factor [Bacteroidota bacterium]